MRTDVIHPRELGAEHLARWRGILAENEVHRSPFYAPEFTLAVGEARADARVAILEDAGGIVGFFPFHRLRAGVAKPIGGPISDYHGPIAAAGAAIDAIELLELCGLSSYDFNHMPTAMTAFSTDAYHHTLSRHIDLSGGYEAYSQDRPKIWKKTIKEMTRRIRKAGREVGDVAYTHHDPSNETYAEHVAHKNQMLARLKVASVLNIPWVQQTLDIIRHTQTPDFAGIMSTVRAGGQLIGAHFGMRSRTDWHWWFPSYDLELAKYGPGIILFDEASRDAERLGVKWIDFGRGDSEYKITFANGATPLCEGSVERPNTRPGLMRKAQKTALRLIKPAPLGRFESYPRRAFGRLISGMRLPSAD